MYLKIKYPSKCLPDIKAYFNSFFTEDDSEFIQFSIEHHEFHVIEAFCFDVQLTESVKKFTSYLRAREFVQILELDDKSLSPFSRSCSPKLDFDSFNGCERP